MKDYWNQENLSKALFDKHFLFTMFLFFKKIYLFLFEGQTSREWRARESIHLLQRLELSRSRDSIQELFLSLPGVCREPDCKWNYRT